MERTKKLTGIELKQYLMNRFGLSESEASQKAGISQAEEPMERREQFDASRVYVGTYAKYNGGSILGKWLDLEDYSDCEEFYAACKELHKDEADPELMFQDFENIPSGMISECHVSKSVWEWLALDENEREILKAYQDNFYNDGSIDDAQNAYVGEWRSFREFAEEYFDESNEIPDHLAYYIDYDAVSRDMGHDYLEAEKDDGNVLIFCRNS